MISEPIHVAIASDPNYFVGVRTTLLSILHSNPDEVFIFHVLEADVDQRLISDLEKKLQQKAPSAQMFSYSVDVSRFEGFGDLSGSKMTYARVLIPSLLDIDKVIYIDCDVLVVGGLRQFWEIAMEGSLAVVVQDADLPYIAGDWPLDSGPPEAKYFNAGVMLIDVQGWRDSHIQKKTLELIQADPSRCRFLDQTALNVVLLDRVVYADRSFNFKSDDFKLGRDSPVVIHYITRYRNPWEGCVINDASLVWVRFYIKHVDGFADQWKFYRGKIRFWRSLKDRFVVRFGLFLHAQLGFLKLKYLLVGKDRKKVISDRVASYRDQYANRIVISSARLADTSIEGWGHSVKADSTQSSAVGRRLSADS